MKKSLSLLTLLLCYIVSMNAQLKVDSLSRVTIGNITSNSRLSIKMDGTYNGLYCNRSVRSDTIDYGIYAYVPSRQGKEFRAIMGNGLAYTIESRVIGVDGQARTNRNATGIPIGVAGRMSASNSSIRGAGVFGATNNTITNSDIDTLYAGFFSGLTKVKGTLIVSGGIQGSLLSKSASPSGGSSAISNSLAENNVTSMLSGLSANTFLYDAPQGMMEARSGNNSGRQSRFANLTDEEIAEIEAHPWDYEEESMPELSAVDRQLYTKQHYGLNVEQLEAVFPDLVYEDENGTKSINYVEMVPILIQAINELKGEINALKGDETTSRDVKKEATGLTKTEDVTLLSLGQNKPNPFGTNTEIEVSIPETVQQAFIYVYDLQGKKVEQVDITTRGKQVVRLSSENLTDGMYMYSLITDGKVVETRRMIVEK